MLANCTPTPELEQTRNSSTSKLQIDHVPQESQTAIDKQQQLIPDCSGQGFGSQSQSVDVASGEKTQQHRGAQESLEVQIIANWENLQALGEIIFVFADTEELRKEAQNYTTLQLNHIKNAANQVWRPSCTSDGEYCGEKVELMVFGNQRDWKVRTENGNILSVARGNVRPWLGI